MSNEDVKAHKDDPFSRTLVESFGVGCFHFGYKKLKEDFDIDVYEKDIRKLLGSLPNVKNIDVSLSGVAFRSGDASAELSLNTAKGLHPWPVSGYIHFYLLIPNRVQEDLSIGRGSCSEDISVRIVFNKHMPVAFLFGEKDIEENPSNMVAIVWKYIRDNLPKDQELTFQMIGPSPFHADFFVYEDEDINELSVTYSEHDGYDRGEIIMPHDMWDKHKFASLSTRIISEDFGFFYEIIQKRNLISRNINEIVEDISILHGNKKRNLRQRFIHFFSTKETTDILINTELARVEIAKLESGCTPLTYGSRFPTYWVRRSKQCLSPLPFVNSSSSSPTMMPA